jgi:hypothetical protein
MLSGFPYFVQMLAGIARLVLQRGAAEASVAYWVQTPHEIARGRL